MTRPSEDDLIARYFAPLAISAGADGLNDDAAVVPPGEGDLVVTKDMVVAGVHFFPDDPPSSIVKKALRVNLSDLAAKGAKPAGFLLGLGLPPDWTEAFLEESARGLAQDIEVFDCPLLGGDTVKMPGPLTLSVTAFGYAPRIVRRRGARPGDIIAVTGTIGDGALGLAVRAAEREPAKAPAWVAGLDDRHRALLALRYMFPMPRVRAASAVAAFASASMDVSDGLAGDLAKLLKASGVGATAAIDDVPLSESARGALALDPSLIRTVLTGGDDYELLVTCPPDRFAAFASAVNAEGLDLTAIGRITAGEGLVISDRSGQAVDLGAGRFQHF
ncbi:thiamine-phosphate kinase [Phreatobacter aquaticus]|uniref:Thiamine-monophosphate kinase n=1 Tax=Phreatobacter aquaticus TaxID=2570229 RepID=A0A4D7QRW3_9HYPH|nr:thiamine-phosphate kinase [Phreatobacter aquaticus]QCK86842.1 thiamine-phosphate kinase [Phreatobacter aquaticus]